MAGLECLSPAIAFDIDLPKAPPSAKKSSVQERLEIWSPKSTSANELEAQQEAASTRKKVTMTTKSATLAKQNERAKDIAERQKSATSATLAERTNTMQEKQMKAEGIRAALMKEQVDKAAQEVSKARELSNKAKEELQDDAQQKRLSLENNLKNASARKQALVAATAEKAAGEYSKAVLMSAQKKKKEEATAMEGEEKLGEKLEGASRRRELFMETQTDKLAATALWGAALRHNACESDAAPVAFEVSVDDVRVKSPDSKSVGKSPVQERWESWAPKGRSIAELDESQAAAQRRKDASITSKAVTLAKQNERVREVAEERQKSTTSTIQAVLNKAQEKQMKAESNRAALMKEQIDKAAQEVSKARELSNKAKEELQDDAQQKRLSLENNLKNASTRKQALVAATAEKAGGEYSKAVLMSAQKKKQDQTVAMEGEEKLGEKLEQASLRRALFDEEQSTKLFAKTEHAAEVRQRKPTETENAVFDEAVDGVPKSPAWIGVAAMTAVVAVVAGGVIMAS